MCLGCVVSGYKTPEIGDQLASAHVSLKRRDAFEKPNYAIFGFDITFG
jgi:hypothetical protein